MIMWQTFNDHDWSTANPYLWNHTFSTSFNPSGEGGHFLQLGVYRALPRKQKHTFSTTFDPSGEGGHFLQLGVYRVLPRDQNHTFSTSFNPSGEGGTVLQLGVYRALPRKSKPYFFYQFQSLGKRRGAHYNWVCIGLSLGSETILVLPLLISREKAEPFYN